MHEIGIIGAGTAGLHLALYLQQHDIQPTLITDRTPEDYRDSRLLNTVAHHATTLQREAELGLNFWSEKDFHYYYHDHWLNTPDPLNFKGVFKKPSRAVDYRIYLPALMEEFISRGGNIEYAQIKESDIPILIKRFDLLVVASGKGPLGALFERDPEHSPFQQAQRHLSVGLYTGVKHPDPKNVTLSITPGQGELLVIPTLTFSGMQTALLLENVPGGDLEQTVTSRYNDNPKEFLQLILDKLEVHHPATYNRIDTTRFDLAQPLDILQGGVVPTVRKTEVELESNKFAIAIGDVHATVDPVNGQGANIASYAAFEMADEIIKSENLGKEFVDKVNARRQARVIGASNWTNMVIQPPSEAFLALLGAMNENPQLCNEFTENFNEPDKQWERLHSAESIFDWIKQTAA